MINISLLTRATKTFNIHYLPHAAKSTLRMFGNRFLLSPCVEIEKNFSRETDHYSHSLSDLQRNRQNINI